MTSTITLIAEETATVLAALRYWQQQGMASEHCRSPELESIATDDGSFKSLAEEDIDGLCERLNGGDPIGGKITNADLYLRTYEGKLVRVEALFPVLPKDAPYSAEPANVYMGSTPGASLHAICNGVALIAQRDDRGQPPEAIGQVGDLHVTEDGEANFYGIAGPAGWVARVQLNGKLHATQQRAMVDAMALALSTPVVAVTPQPATPTVALNVPLTDEFIGDVLATMVESGYPWFEWREEERVDDPADLIGWRYGSALAVEIDDEDQSEEGEGQRRKIDGYAIAEAIGKILRGGMCRTDLTEAIAGGIASMDAGMIDADAADCIAQVAVFDEIRYG